MLVGKFQKRKKCVRVLYQGNNHYDSLVIEDSSIHSSNDVDQVDNELGKILDAKTIESPSL